MYSYQEPVLKIILLQHTDICTASKEEDDPWDDPNWDN